MDRTEIIKALECCLTPKCSNCMECPARQSLTGTDCLGLVIGQTLSLIKELTEENERSKEICGMKECVIENAEAVIARTKADTVRKMQERFIAEIEQTPNANEHFIKVWKSKIDQIAKDMLEEK